MISKLLRLNKSPFSTLSQRISSQLTPYNNIPGKIISLCDKALIKKPSHPLGRLKEKIQGFFSDPNVYKSPLQQANPLSYIIKDDFDPIVSAQQNFDDLLIPVDHVSRKKADSYYLSETTLLRTHTSAHQKHMLQDSHNAFCVFGDVYRRDTIDGSHYPIFHQMEAVRIFNPDVFHSKQRDVMIAEVASDLQRTLESLVKSLFGDLQMRWVPAYFPFTDPSFEMEIFFNNEWMEVLGCGVVHKDVMKNGNRREEEIGWAAGLGLERFAMLLFGINDIRLFWSDDRRFLGQFQAGKITRFEPFSKYPICYKDFTFWIPKEGEFEENELCEVVRNIGGDLIEKVSCIDTYENKKMERTSKCFRIFFRSLERTLQNSEINTLQGKIREDFKNVLKLDLR